MPEERKLVSVLFADTVGSTALGAEHDPELVRTTMARYFDRMRAIAERHGGTVEKFIGDAVMVVFGVPRVHDDDAERAVRAGLAMRDELAELNRELAVELAARVGINSGEAVAETSDASQFLVTGDVVNVAARLQQGADVGEVVVGALTEQLTRVAVEYRSHEPIVAKGKATPLRAFTAVRAKSVVPSQARGLPAMRAALVGRDRELKLLLDTIERAKAERAVHVFTLLGEPGVGKSRLVGECLARLRDEPVLLRGRCLPYGAGITYWPLMEILRAQAGIAGADDRASALANLDVHLATVLSSSADLQQVRARLLVLLGLESPAVALPDIAPGRVHAEIGWALRRYLEALTARRPAVIVVDDLQWAEPALIEVVDGILDRMRGVPLALICVARPELTEVHPRWSVGRTNASTMTLEGLDAAETTTLISRLLDIDDLPAALRKQIATRSEGNPLFCEEFLRMLIEDGRVVQEGGRWRATPDAATVAVPETIVALLAASIDRLDPQEKRALQLASIIGERFDLAEVVTLAEDASPSALDALERRGLILEDREVGGAGAMRFKHLLVREVAYGSLAKADRAPLHERFATALEAEAGDRRDEFAEILAHHTEQAFTLSAELRLPREVLVPRAARAGVAAVALAERAELRGDLTLMERFLAVSERAATVAGDGGLHDRNAFLRVRALLLAGRLNEARPAAIAALAAARAAGDLGRAAGIARTLAYAEMWGGALADIESAHETARELSVAAGHAAGVIEMDALGLEWDWGSGNFSKFVDGGVALIERAQAMGDQTEAAQIMKRVAGAARIAGRLDLADRYAAEANEIAGRFGLRALLRELRAGAAASAWFAGDAAAALAILDEVTVEAAGDDDGQRLVNAGRRRAEILEGEGRYEEAVVAGAAVLAESVRTGERWNRSEIHGHLAVNLLRVGRTEEAKENAAEATAMVRGPEDISGVAEAEWVRAHVLAVRGDDEAAEAAFNAAIVSADRGEFVPLHISLRLDLAEFLIARKRGAEAAALLAEVERLAPPPPWNFLPGRRRALAA
ncbi:MAG TPA: adenylate/guanylate cyclase domain-containing protein, partial [Candidatus Limnocylindria bacterium]